MTKRILAAALAMLLLLSASVALTESVVKAKTLPFGKFSAANILDEDGEPVTEAIFAEAELTLVNIWATWCGPCKAELPDLAKLNESTEGRAQVIGILLDTDTDPYAVEDAKTLLAAANATYPVLIPDKWLNMLGGLATSIPTTFLVDKDGMIVGSHIGSQDEAGWLKTIEGIIGAEK